MLFNWVFPMKKKTKITKRCFRVIFSSSFNMTSLRLVYGHNNTAEARINICMHVPVGVVKLNPHGDNSRCNQTWHGPHTHFVTHEVTFVQPKGPSLCTVESLQILNLPSRCSFGLWLRCIQSPAQQQTLQQCFSSHFVRNITDSLGVISVSVIVPWHYITWLLCFECLFDNKLTWKDI